MVLAYANDSEPRSFAPRLENSHADGGASRHVFVGCLPAYCTQAEGIFRALAARSKLWWCGGGTISWGMVVDYYWVDVVKHD